MAIPLRLKIDDAPEVGVPVTETVGVPVTEGELSALAEAMCLQGLGQFGTVQTALLRLFATPDLRLDAGQKRLLRIALGAANEGVQIMQAVTMSTTRRR